MENLIPSPLLGGDFKKPVEITDKDVEELCKKYEADSGVFIVFRREQVPCRKECNGLHSAGGDYNLSDTEKVHIIQMLMDEWGLSEE